MQAKFQRLLDLVHRKKLTRDRHGQAMPDRLELVKVINIANIDLWADYMTARENIRQELEADGEGFARYEVATASAGGLEPEAEAIAVAGESSASIAESLAAEFEEPLDASVNEAFFFHGTNADAAEKISVNDFCINLAGSNAGTLYGRGVYLAENASKSDEYTTPLSNGERHLLLCRAILGRAYYTATVENDPRECEDACLKGKYHSVLGDRKMCRGTFREFVIFDTDQVYANYILTYRRTYAPGTRTMKISVPPGTAAGSLVSVRSPEGAELQVTVPVGLAPGQAFDIKY